MHKYKHATRLTLLASVLLAAIAPAYAAKPTIVLVHGAFADASSWNGVAAILLHDGYPVVAVANPLRSVKGDGQYVADIVAGIKTPVVLVGHSYGGMVISDASKAGDNVRALVYVSAFAPDVGETGLSLSGKFPGSTLGATLAAPVTLTSGGVDLYIDQAKFPAQFAADVPLPAAKLMAATQRPVTKAALSDGAVDPAWKRLPSWYVYGSADLNIPPAAQAFMATRAKSKQAEVIKGASHVTMVSHPKQVAAVIENAAKATE